MSHQFYNHRENPKAQTPKFVCGLAVIGGRSQLHKVPWESWDAEVLKSRSGGSFISLTKSTATATMKKSFAPRSVSDSGKADDDGLVRNLTLTRALSSVHSKEWQSITVANFRCQNTQNTAKHSLVAHWIESKSFWDFPPWLRVRRNLYIFWSLLNVFGNLQSALALLLRSACACVRIL